MGSRRVQAIDHEVLYSGRASSACHRWTRELPSSRTSGSIACVDRAAHASTVRGACRYRPIWRFGRIERHTPQPVGVAVEPFLWHSTSSDNRTCDLRMQTTGPIGDGRHVAIVQRRVPEEVERRPIHLVKLATNRSSFAHIRSEGRQPFSTRAHLVGSVRRTLQVLGPPVTRSARVGSAVPP
jgi:hypothetical protein